MLVSYRKLWKLLIDHDMRKQDLISKAGIASSTLAKMWKNEYVSLEVLVRICMAMNCNIGDIIDVVWDKKEILDQK